jgi:hypothetical protein
MNVVSMPWSVEPGENYGAPIDAVLAYATARGFSREDFLRLAWAALDQGSTHATARDTRNALETIGNLLPAESDQ